MRFGATHYAMFYIEFQWGNKPAVGSGFMRRSGRRRLSIEQLVLEGHNVRVDNVV